MTHMDKIVDFTSYRKAKLMLKATYEQVDLLKEVLRGRINEDTASVHFSELASHAQLLHRTGRLILTGCGSSYYAALVGEYVLEEIARIPVEVEYASEFRYRNPPMDRNTVVMAVSQSGETADTLAALREAKRRGHMTLAVCGAAGSSIAREADGGIGLSLQPEANVTSVTAFMGQVMLLTMLALYLGRMRHLSSQRGERMIRELQKMPEVVRRALSCESAVCSLVARYADMRNFLCLGRQYLYPVALEGALKLKELSHVHAEAFPAAELKHGPIALIDADVPSLVLIPRSAVYDKVMSNLEEIKARGGPVIAVACEGDERVAVQADDAVFLPDVPDYLQPLVTIVPLQLL
ncbi:MAG: SIS domain-containing protein, partial [Planctomycetes bacterium]|nr:SIS domain-containing protein [Planctomycetota bacterium]